MEVDARSITTPCLLDYCKLTHRESISAQGTF